MRRGALTLLKEMRFLFNRLPFYIILYPTSRCNARCPHCFNYLRQSEASVKGELSLDEIDKITGKLGHVKVLTITGGEPFLRDDLSKIVSLFYKHNGVQYVSLHTNAFLTEKVSNTISEVLESFPDLQVIVCVSIDCVGEEHNKFRGVENGFDKLLQTVAKLKELKKEHQNLHLISSTIFSRSTMNSLSDTIRYLQDNIGGMKTSLSFIRGDVANETEKTIDVTKYRDFYRKFGYAIDKTISPFSPMAFKEALETVVNRFVIANYTQYKQTVPCQAGRKIIVVYENGDVYPCELLKEKFGNLREVDYDIRRLLFSKKGRETIKKIRQKKSCHCTWENIIPVNILFSPRYYPTVIAQWYRLFILKKGNRRT